MDKNYSSISSRLAAYRELMNLNQTQMGEKLGVTQSQYSKQESGLKGVSFHNLKHFEENGGDAFFLITGEHRQEGKLEQYLERFTSDYEKEWIFKILVWVAELGLECLEDRRVTLTECTEKCIRLMQVYSEDQTIWRNIREAERSSQVKMAEIFDINVKRYRDIEKEKSMPDAEILQTLYEKLHYSPLLILNKKLCYLDELNRIWEAMPQDYLKESLVFIKQAEKLIRMSEKKKKEAEEEE